jgi:hypothetical protein
MGEGCTAEMRGLTLRVDVAEDGWRYSIREGADLISDHQPCYPQDQTLQLAQLRAVAKGLEYLESTEDPISELQALRWLPLPPTRPGDLPASRPDR